MDWLQALADPIRLGIVRHLAGYGPASRNELASAVTAAPETVRRHLLSLERAGVVEPVMPEQGSGSRGRPPMHYRLVRQRAVQLTIIPGLYRCRQCEGSILRGLREEPRVAGGSCPVCGGPLEYVERRSAGDRRVTFQPIGSERRRGMERRRDLAAG